MKQLTTNEIIELRARAMYESTNSQYRQLNTWEQATIKNKYRKLAKAAIEADEKAGVLMLVIQ